MLLRTSALVVAAVIAFHAPALAESPKPAAIARAADRPFDLMVGDKAPPLAIAKWVKGNEVTGFERGHVYVVEFWATWCGPCIRGMPHLTKLQKDFKDKATIIGVTRQDTRGNTLEAVEKMVAEKADVMGYTVAWDDESKTNQAYMRAAAQRFIPTAFVVDKEGRVAHITNNVNELDKVLAQIVDGTYDLNAAIASYHADAVKRKSLDDLEQAVQKKDWAAGLKALERLEASDPQAAPAMLRFRALTGAGRPEAARVGAELLEKHKDQAQALNQIAWFIVDPELGIRNPDTNLALKAALRAAELTKEQDAAILDTLARVYFTKGDVRKAVELQGKAVNVATGKMKEDLAKVLDEYKAAAK